MTLSQHSYELMDLLTGYQRPAILMAAHRLGIFRTLAAAERSAAQLAADLQLPPHSLNILLQASVALGFLEQHADRYCNGPMVAATLQPGAPGYIGRLVDKEAVFYRAWGDLAEAVRTDQARLAPIGQRARSDPEQTHNFLLALDDIARLYGAGFVEHAGLSEALSLLDVGGGVGNLAVALARTNRNLQVTVLDLPEVVPWTREFVAQAGLADRITARAFDFLSHEFPAGHDAVLLSNIFHDQPSTINRGLLAKAYRALPAGGRVSVYDFILNPDGVTPAASAVFGVMMLVENQGGNVYTAAEIESWLADAGFETVETVRLPPPSPMGVVSAVKPGEAGAR